MGGNISGTLKGQEPFSIHVITNPRSGTFHMYFAMFLTLSLTNNQSSHFNPSLNVPTIYPHIPSGLHLSQSSLSYSHREHETEQLAM